jgi:hypothetical protein
MSTADNQGNTSEVKGQDASDVPQTQVPPHINDIIPPTQASRQASAGNTLNVTPNVMKEFAKLLAMRSESAEGGPNIKELANLSPEQFAALTAVPPEKMAQLEDIANGLSRAFGEMKEVAVDVKLNFVITMKKENGEPKISFKGEECSMGVTINPSDAPTDLEERKAKTVRVHVTKDAESSEDAASSKRKRGDTDVSHETNGSQLKTMRQEGEPDNASAKRSDVRSPDFRPQSPDYRAQSPVVVERDE